MHKETNPEGVLPEHKLTKVQCFWLKHHQACQTSGKSQADYAREHGLAIKSLYYWKKRLQQIGAIDTDLSSAAPGKYSEALSISPSPFGRRLG